MRFSCRPIYLIYRLGQAIASASSRALNAGLLGGSTYQTTSSRAHIESLTSKRWARAKKWINRIFFWQVDHCAEAWADEVMRAQKTLARNGAI